MVFEKITFHVPLKISTNKFYSGMHWRQRNDIKDLFRQMAFVAMPIKDFPVDIHYKFYLKGKRIDSLNLSIMSKMIEDCLVKRGILPNDDPKFVRISSMESVQHKSENYCEVQIKKAE